VSFAYSLTKTRDQEPTVSQGEETIIYMGETRISEFDLRDCSLDCLQQ